MTATALLLIAAGAWILTGAITGFFMARKGHVMYAWTLLGALFGPLVIPLAIDARRHAHQGLRETVLEPGISHEGPIDVLVGMDGSSQSLDALEAATLLFGERIGTLALVSVLDFDAESSEEGRLVAERAGQDLIRHSEKVKEWDPQRLLLSGRPDEALAKYALEHNFEVIAIGAKGRGLSKTLLGSVAARLASGSDVPVLIVS